VGAGNSGAEISLELVRAGKKVVLSGRDVGRIPAASPIGRAFDGRLIWWIMENVLNVNTPVGRKVRAAELHHGAPLGRATRQELAGAGVELAPRLSGIQSGNPQLEDGRVLPVEGVLWATGFRPDYDWIDLPILDEQGYPRHRQGVVENMPGIYFVGLQFQTALTSSLLGGVGRDAKTITRQIRNGRNLRTPQPSTAHPQA
jgi:putative flavoprotein involved in K+ transport